MAVAQFCRRDDGVRVSPSPSPSLLDTLPSLLRLHSHPDSRLLRRIALFRLFEMPPVPPPVTEARVHPLRSLGLRYGARTVLYRTVLYGHFCTYTSVLGHFCTRTDLYRTDLYSTQVVVFKTAFQSSQCTIPQPFLSAQLPEFSPKSPNSPNSPKMPEELMTTKGKPVFKERLPLHLPAQRSPRAVEMPASPGTPPSTRWRARTEACGRS